MLIQFSFSLGHYQTKISFLCMNNNETKGKKKQKLEKNNKREIDNQYFFIKFARITWIEICKHLRKRKLNSNLI